MFWLMHNGSTTGWGWAWIAFGWLWMLLFWGGIIALVIWIVRRLTERSEARIDRPSPLEIAKSRYARGEITREAYEQLRNDLQQS